MDGISIAEAKANCDREEEQGRGEYKTCYGEKDDKENTFYGIKGQFYCILSFNHPHKCPILDMKVTSEKEEVRSWVEVTPY